MGTTGGVDRFGSEVAPRPDPLRLAGFDVRFWAWAVDFLAIGGAAGLLEHVLDVPWLAFTVMVGNLVVAPCLFGASAGKRAYGLRVVRRDGSRPALWQPAVRGLQYALLLLPLGGSLPRRHPAALAATGAFDGTGRTT